MQKSKWQKIKSVLKKWIAFLLNPRLLLCLGIAWMITNGWCYVFIAVGGFLNITWMFVAGSSYAVMLWLPFTPEKILTLIIAIFLLRLMFPKDEKTLLVLKEELANGKRKWNQLRASRKRKRRVRHIARVRKK